MLSSLHRIQTGDWLSLHAVHNFLFCLLVVTNQSQGQPHPGCAVPVTGSAHALRAAHHPLFLFANDEDPFVLFASNYKPQDISHEFSEANRGLFLRIKGLLPLKEGTDRSDKESWTKQV